MVVWGVHDRGGQSADLARWIAKGADLFVRSFVDLWRCDDGVADERLLSRRVRI